MRSVFVSNGFNDGEAACVSRAVLEELCGMNCAEVESFMDEKQEHVVEGIVVIDEQYDGNKLPRLCKEAVTVLSGTGELKPDELAQERARGARRALAAAHDLRNELTRALLFEARSRHHEPTGDRPGTEARDELERALQAARELAQQALRGDHGALFARPLEPVPLRALLEQECRAASEAARTEPGASPRLRLRAPAHLRVLARPGSFERAVRNLVTNALEAAARRRGAEGTVSVWAEPVANDSEAPEQARRRAAGFTWSLAVEDDGVGMDAGRLQRFLDAPPAAGQGRVSSNHPASTGLGTASLAVALEDSGLPIRVHSRSGAGTRVDIALRQAPLTPLQLIVDRDLRRGPRLQREAGGSGAAWWIANEDAAALLGSAAASSGEGAPGAPPLSAS